MAMNRGDLPEPVFPFPSTQAQRARWANRIRHLQRVLPHDTPRAGIDLKDLSQFLATLAAGGSPIQVAEIRADNPVERSGAALLITDLFQLKCRIWRV